MNPLRRYLLGLRILPFHPSIKDLYARFKENEGFQQTRGLIRLMRLIVRQLYQGDKPRARQRQLISVFDFDLSEQDMFSAITDIKPSLTNAIAHDIFSSGKAVAEIVDLNLGETSMQELSKLILVASLADVPNALLGLTDKECIGYLASPGRDITRYKKAMDEFLMRAWYLYTDKDGRIYFRNTKNLIAEMNTLVDSYDPENAIKELRVFLEEKFRPKLGDCYQVVQVFPAVDEIVISEDKNTLVLFDPYTGSSSKYPGLHQTWLNCMRIRYKNRIAFLSGQRSTREKLIRAAKEHKAINVIIERMDEEKTPKATLSIRRLTKREIRSNWSYCRLPGRHSSVSIILLRTAL